MMLHVHYNPNLYTQKKIKRLSHIISVDDDKSDKYLDHDMMILKVQSIHGGWLVTIFVYHPWPHCIIVANNYGYE